MRMWLLLVLVAGSVLSVNGQARYDFSKLDQYFDTLEHHDRLMGTIAIMRKDELLYTRALGDAVVANEANQIDAIPADVTRRYRVGSITKTFVAALILELVEQEKVKLTEKLSTWFPQIPNASQITVRQMLNHTAGINSITDDRFYLIWRTQEMPREKMLASMAEREASFAPGKGYAYSNSGYILLGYIAEEVSGKSLAEALDQYVFQPLDLQSSEMSQPVDPGNNEAMSYSWSSTTWQPEPNDHPTVPGGAGALSATVTDVAKFYRGLFAGRLLDSASLAAMMDVGENNYGYGMLSFPFGKRTAYGHTGGISGFRSMAAHFTDDSTTVAFLGNGIRTTPNDVLLTALAALYQSEFELPDFNLRKATYTVKDLKALQGIYSTAEFPLAITIGINDKTLTAEATGQAAFKLEAYTDYVFKYELAGIEIKFHEPGKFTLKQGGRTFEFVREEP